MTLRLPWVSIRTKLSAPIALTMVLFGLGAAGVVHFRVRESLEEELHRRALTLSSELSLELTAAALVEDMDGLEQSVDGAVNRPDVLYVVVLGASGGVLANSLPGGIPDDLIEIFGAPRAEVDKPLAYRTDEGVVFDYAVPMLEGRLGTIHLGISQARIDSRATAEARLIFGLAAVAALVTALLVYLVAHLVTRPLRALSDAASRVGDGTLEVRSRIDSADEVGDLSDRFDEMIERLGANAAELEDAHRMMVRTERMTVVGNVASGIAHEIGNPLHAARQFAEALRENPDAGERYLPLIDEALQRIDRVIAQLLSFSREQRLEPRPCQVNDVVHQSADFLRYDPRSQAVGLDLDLGEDLPSVLVDPDSLNQVLLSLMFNSLDALEGSGNLRVSTTVHKNGQSSGDVVVSIGDDGPGIPAGVAEHIFEPFFTTKAAGQGTGLGLSISQEILTAQGGSIEFLTDSGPGAHFEIRLPFGPRVPG